MWTKDYLVRGFIKRRGKHRRIAAYDDEWQALFRVEGARRQLKAARLEAEEQRQAILAWDIDVLRDKIMAAARVAAQREQDAAAYEKRRLEEAEARVRQEQRLGHYIAEHRRKALATPVPAWAAWAWAKGLTQAEVGAQLGSSGAAVSGWTHSYVVAFWPQGVKPDSGGYPRFAFDKWQVLQNLFRGKPEPPRPECWRPREPARRVEVPPELRWAPGMGAKEQREISRRRHAWAWARRQEGWPLAAIGRGLVVSPERVRQMLSTEVGRRYNRAKTLGSWYLTRTNLGRPLDMGGPRDQWLEYRLEDAR